MRYQYGINKLRDAVSSKEDTNIVNTIDENADSTENTTSEGQNEEETAENIIDENVTVENVTAESSSAEGENSSANEVTE